MRDFLNYVVYSSHKKDGVKITIEDILIILACYLLTVVLLRVIYRFLNRHVAKESRAKIKLAFNFFKYFVIFLVMMIALRSVGIDLSAILLGSTAILVGLGLGLQKLFQDIISGIIIILDKSIKVDDVIEIEGRKGRISEISLRTTRMTTKENKTLIIPNHLFLDNSIYNWTQNEPITRDFIAVGVAYGSDLKRVKETLLEAVKSEPNVLKEPEPVVIFENFADSALAFKVFFSTAEVFSSEVIKSNIRFEINRLFENRGIDIPFPQQDVHIISRPL